MMVPKIKNIFNIIITVVKLEREEEVDVIEKQPKDNCNIIIEAKQIIDGC